MLSIQELVVNVMVLDVFIDKKSMKRLILFSTLLFLFTGAFSQTIQGYFFDDNDNSVFLSNLGKIRVNNKEEGIVYKGDYSLSAEPEPGGTYRIYLDLDGLGSGEADLVWPLRGEPRVYLDGRTFYAR